MDIKQFLQTVVTASQPGYFCLAVGNGSGWVEQWHQWPQDIDKIVERAVSQADHANVYFSSYLFRSPQSTRENVLPTRTIQADLDDAELKDLPRKPTVLIETSPNRHQAYWVLDQELDLEKHQLLSKKLTYSIPLCDRSGWPLGRKVRVPGTLNHKYLTGPKPVKIIAFNSDGMYNADDFEALPEVPQFVSDHFDKPEFIENPVGVEEHPLEILERIRNDIPTSVYVQYSLRQPDRSEALWALMCWGFKVGLSREEVFTLASGSENNKFADLKHRGSQDLAKDVLRAEHVVNSEAQDPKQLINSIRKKTTNPVDRKRAILAVVLKTLREQGEFIHTREGFLWYIRKDVGRPIALGERSEYFGALLDLQFGLNSTEVEQHYVVSGVRAHVQNIGETGSQHSLSYYSQTDGQVLIHTGRKTVIKVTRNGFERAVDGAYSVVFPWHPSIDPFEPQLNAARERKVDWGEELFGNGERGFGSSVDNLTNMNHDQAMALLKVWLLFVLFRAEAGTRPILATFGAPGSGKTSLFKKVYRFLYGSHKSLTAVTNVDDFDYSMATDPLVVLDNVDTWERWLPDRMALSAGVSDVTKRKLYTDSDTVTLRRQAVLGVTAHNPKFGREDVADRFLMLAYRRFDEFVSEALILDDLLKKRNLLWGAVLNDIQKVLNTPTPPSDEVPQFRIEDFARMGLWIARGLGCAKDFVSAIEDVKIAQQRFSLEEDGVLVQAIERLVKSKREDPLRGYTASQLWTVLETCSSDARVFERMYGNSVRLSKKITALTPSLRTQFDIRVSSDDKTGARIWTITEKERFD